MNCRLRELASTLRRRIFPSKIISDYVKVETSAECNARCVWCWMFRCENKPRGLMKLRDFKRFIDINKSYFLAHRIGVMPFFNGECLIHPRIFEIFDYIVESGIRLMDLDTNLGMKIDVSKLMGYPFKFIRVNIGGVTRQVHEDAMGTDFNLVVENLRKAFKNDAKRIIVKMVVTKTNVHQIGQMEGFLRKLGGLPENRIVAPTGFALPSLATDSQIKEFFDEVVSEEVNEYLKFDYDLSKIRYGIRTKERRCQYLLNCITFDGKLTICCQDQFGRINLGNAFRTPMIKLVSSQEYGAALRKAKNREFDFCEECN
jgi:MoaA/NifB/PqqE/SkfB family radical SAM enzyme